MIRCPHPLIYHTQLPLSLLRAASGSPLLVELKGGDTYNGRLASIDAYMNMNLVEVICTAADGQTFWKLPSAYVRGSAIKYLRLPPTLLQEAAVQEAAAEDERRQQGRGRGGGGGRGRGGRYVGYIATKLPLRKTLVLYVVHHATPNSLFLSSSRHRGRGGRFDGRGGGRGRGRGGRGRGRGGNDKKSSGGDAK
jgi:U6 snRNA-associated Sm-like protein LSm4